MTGTTAAGEFGGAAAAPAPLDGVILLSGVLKAWTVRFDHVGCHASRWMRWMICANRRWVNWLSTNCTMKYRACRMRRPPVLNSSREGEDLRLQPAHFPAQMINLVVLVLSDLMPRGR